MIDNMFVLDAVAHAYNHLPENWEDPVLGQAMVDLAYALAADPPDPQYAMSREDYLRDWSVEDAAKLLFGESNTDVAVVHPLAISSFKDGYSSVPKAAEAISRYPSRFIGAYACVDPLKGAGAIRALEEQADLFKPLGLKLYPTSWDGKGPVSWRMDDPKLIYPLYERAAKLGLKHVASHKAVPIGPFAVGDAYNPSDLENAATDFPDLSFEIVHGGLAFLDETAWLLGRFSNVYVNMEIHNIIVERRPKVFEQILLGLCKVGGTGVLDRMFWGSGGTLHHPQPGLEAFAKFEFSEESLDSSGLFMPMKQITRANKENMLSGTFARLHGIDLDACKRAIAGDEFSRPADAALPKPYSTITMARPADARLENA